MNYIFNRMVHNDFQWNKPSPGRKGPNGEGAYVQENGFGHEDWNFNYDFSIDGYIYGYSYYKPAENKRNEKFNIVFSTYKNRNWFVVGFYENASYIENPPFSLEILKIKMQHLLLLGNSLGNNFKNISNDKFIEKLKEDSNILNYKVLPNNIILLDNPVLLPKEIFETKNYRISTPKIITEEDYNRIKIFIKNYIFIPEETEFPEGREIEKLHKVKERNSDVVKLAKQKYFERTHSYKCEICNFDFFENYGEIGKGFIEAHHIKALSELSGEISITINDFAMLCSNCHRMLHRKRPWLTVDKLKELLIK